MNEQRIWTIVWVTITIFVITTTFLPGLIHAGNLQPSAPPGSTMKTLDEVPPTWSQKLPASERFELVFSVRIPGGIIPQWDYKAVLDKETGLVWERYPDVTARDWYEASAHCYTREVGGRKGWRLPTIEELASLVDPANTNPSLPTAHPFSSPYWDWYWSSSTHARYTDCAWCAFVYDGRMISMDKSSDYCVWCVRGGHGHDAY